MSKLNEVASFLDFKNNPNIDSFGDCKPHSMEYWAGFREGEQSMVLKLKSIIEGSSK